MTAVELLQRARDLGLRLEPRDGGRLAVCPASKLPPALAAELRHHKSQVIGLLTGPMDARADAGPAGLTVHTAALRREWQSVPPADLPLVTLKPSTAPSNQELVIAYLSRQCAHQPLREWLTRRKVAYGETIAATWHRRLIAYAAGRDAACWQLNRSESEVWSLLEGIESCLNDLKFRQMT